VVFDWWPNRDSMTTVLVAGVKKEDGGAVEILDYLEVVHVLVRRPHSSCYSPNISGFDLKDSGSAKSAMLCWHPSRCG
jgi:hypothetical protein